MNQIEIIYMDDLSELDLNTGNNIKIDNIIKNEVKLKNYWAKYYNPEKYRISYLKRRDKILAYKRLYNIRRKNTITIEQINKRREYARIYARRRKLRLLTN